MIPSHAFSLSLSLSLSLSQTTSLHSPRDHSVLYPHPTLIMGLTLLFESHREHTDPHLSVQGQLETSN
jgi:hypothetical protein